MTIPGSPGGGRRWAVDRTILRFTAVGLLTTLLDIGLFSGLTHAAGLAPAAANLVSYSCGIATSFALNRRWTFDAAGRAGARAFLRFAASNAAGLALSTAIVAALSAFLPGLFAKVVSVPVVFVWNYLLARHWVFA